MDREKLLQNPLPIDRVAARVVAPGEWWEPGICKNEPYWDTPPPMMDVPKALFRQPNFTDYRGKLVGFLTVVGFHAHGNGTSANCTRWVLRCRCGNFVIRKGSSIRRNLDPVACCPRCVAKRKITGIRHENAVNVRD